MNKSLFILALAMMPSLTGYVYSQDYKPVENTAALEISFADSSWDGITVPEGQQCSMFGGEGSSPALIVNNIPAGANALIVSFSDRSFKPNDNGGHGIIGIWLTNGESSMTVPSVFGETTEMPENMFVESLSRSTRGEPAAYLPPCSGGRGNEYYATVTAVYKGKTDKEESQLLGEGTIELGKY